MDFDRFIDQAWTEHATDPAAVAARLQGEGLLQLTDAARIPPFAHLAHHVFGEHLGRWQDGVQLPNYGAGGVQAPRRQTIDFGINYCRDGQPPRSPVLMDMRRRP